tara:strand:+ start:6124 stop:8229 length:2106 start_codon:yes stop_codon:yes gene_type:complete
MATSAELYAPNETDSKWVDRLELSGAGRQLMEHLKAIDATVRNNSRTECAPQQCADFRRLFCYAFSKSERCFGLPKKTPKCVCIVNLSGYRAMFYSDNFLLIRLLCMGGPEASQRTIIGVQKMFDVATEHNTNLLLCFSLPWQAGVERVHWDLRTLERESDGTVRDGRRAFSYTFEDPRQVTNTNDVDIDDPRILEEQELFFSRHFSCACLDIELTQEQEMGMQEDAGFSWSTNQVHQLKSLLATVTNQRQCLINDLNDAKAEHKAELEAKETSCKTRITKIIDKNKQASDIIKEKQDAMDEHNATLRAQIKDLRMENQTLQCQKAESELLWGSERQKLTTTAKLQENAAITANKQLSSFQRNAQKNADKLENAHRTALEEKDRRISAVQLEARRSEQRGDSLAAEKASLEEVCTQLRSDTARLSIDLHNSRRRCLGFKCAVAAACSKHSTVTALVANTTEEVKKARMAHVEALDALRNAQDEVSVLQMEIESKRAKTTTVAINTEPMQDPQELIKLREDYALLHEESAKLRKDAFTFEEEIKRLEKRATKKARPPPPQGLLDSEDSSQESQPAAQEPAIAVALPIESENDARQPPKQRTPKSIEIDADPKGDPATEALIHQASSAMTALANMARQACLHKNTATCMFSELSALKQFIPQNAYLEAPGWHNLPAVHQQHTGQHHGATFARSPHRGRGGRMQ